MSERGTNEDPQIRYDRNTLDRLLVNADGEILGRAYLHLSWPPSTRRLPVEEVEDRIRLWAAAPEMKRALGMGNPWVDGPNMLRQAAGILRGHGSDVTADALDAKADAEEAALKAAKGEDS